MEAPLINGAIGAVISKLTSVIEERRLLRKELQKNLEDITKEMKLMNATIEDYHSEIRATGQPQKLVKEEWIRQVHDFAYDIEDCIDVFQGRVRCSHKSSPLSRALHRVKTFDARTEFATEIKQLKGRLDSLNERGNKWAPVNGGDANIAASTTAAVPHVDHAPEGGLDDLEGIDQPKREILELLEETTGQEAATQLRVISIVGCRGLGKTALARAVYESDDVARQFPCRAWVVASKYSRDDVAELLREILRQVRTSGSSTTTSVAQLKEHLGNNSRDYVGELLREILQVRASGSDTAPSVAQLKESLSTHVGNNRYLVVIDDVQQVDEWKRIQYAFPNNGTSSRIIVTTSVKSVATTCSSGSYLYGMKALAEVPSRNLFWKKVFGNPTKKPTPDLDRDSESIFNKCEGLPLALVSIGQFLSSKPELTGTVCKEVCGAIGDHLGGEEPAFQEMQKVLIRSYDTLPRQDIKNCLLYVSIFPKDCQISRKRIVRRWLAEGLVDRDVERNEEDKAEFYFEKLIDQNFIQPVDIANNAKVKTCQVHGIMLAFIVNKSVKENFIALIHPDKVLLNNGGTVRRLCIHDSGRNATDIDLSSIRSLTIFKHDGEKLVDLRQCKVLRVLDLENCKGLKDSVLDSICQLLQLRYLSLRGTNVSKIPSKISRLEYLDTLDLRDTEVVVLPILVLTLPRLAHLFGRFQLPCELKKASRKLQDFLSNKSRLQTLAGFEMNKKNRGFEHIIVHMKRLEKVKIWSKIALNKELTNLLVSSLQKRFNDTNKIALKFLSINFNGISVDFLDSLQAPCVLSSIKLRGELRQLPGFIQSLESLRELRLVSTGLNGSVLSVLQKLPCLVYLKLVDDNAFGDAPFDVNSDGFPSIQRLCLQARSKLPKVSIAEGAMRHLILLKLFCENVDGVDVANITHLGDLKEVILYSSINDDTKEAWKNAASRHDNRPKISYRDIVEHPTANGHASS